MTRTQIQLPDEVYARAKQLCQVREISLAELARRGIEHILSVYSSAAVSADEWHLPKPRDLGWKGLSHARVKEQAQLTAAELQHGGKSKRD
jgi:hypothetical protein